MMNNLKYIRDKINKIIMLPLNMYNALKTFNDIKNMKMMDDDIVIILLKGIGDTVYGLAFIEAVKNIYDPSNIIVVGNVKLKELIETYRGISLFVPYDVDKGEYYKYKNYLEFGRFFDLGYKERIFNTDPYSKYISTVRSLDNSAINILKKRVFKLDDDVSITYPRLIKGNITSIPQFDEICNKVVIINPYTNSFSDSTYELFKGISEYLLEKGFIVYTNLINGQKNIDGTNPLYCSINELTTIIKRSIAFVSIRSGVLDMVINTGTPILAIYNECSKRFKDIYHLKAWSGKSNLEELYLDKKNSKSILSLAKEWCDSQLK